MGRNFANMAKIVLTPLQGVGTVIESQPRSGPFELSQG